MMVDILTAIAADPFPASNPNRPARGEEAWLDRRPYYDLLFVEFDDQGRLFDPQAIDRVMEHLGEASRAADVVVTLFVHGWKHSAREEDENVQSVHRLLHTAGHTEALTADGEVPRRVVGIYVGWRGLSLHWAGLLENLTFWGRKEAALRVAVGSARELFAKLRQFRLTAGSAGKKGTRLVIAGHSFGGLIVHAAIAEYLVESAVTAGEEEEPILPFGDLSILVNPAFEASRYYPLHSIVARKRFAPRQAPVFIAVTAENDWATGLAFPTGRHLTPYTGSSIDQREHDTNFDTVGHVLWMQTHELTASPAADTATVKLIHKEQLSDADRKARIAAEDEAYKQFIARETGLDGRLHPGWTRHYSAGAVLRNVTPVPAPGDEPMSPENPFWIVRASPDVVDGHNGIFGFVFLDFLRQVMDDTVRAGTASKER